MSDYIDTREGWKQVPSPNFPPKDVRTLVERDATGKVVSIWRHDDPVPLLPTAPYTVIRVTPPAAYEAGIPMLYVHDGTRYAMVSLNSWLSLENAEDAADFGVEVLSEPRAVTAKAVLDRVWDYNEGSAAWIVKRIAPEFGVTDE